MSTSKTPNARLTLLALAISSFGIGSTEFISVDCSRSSQMSLVLL